MPQWSDLALAKGFRLWAVEEQLDAPSRAAMARRKSPVTGPMSVQQAVQSPAVEPARAIQAPAPKKRATATDAVQAARARISRRKSLRKQRQLLKAKAASSAHSKHQTREQKTPVLKNTNSAVVTSIVASLLSAEKGPPEELPINCVENEGEHDRTPLFERGEVRAGLFPVGFTAPFDWLRSRWSDGVSAQASGAAGAR
jgi:hypothetical protein